MGKKEIEIKCKGAGTLSVSNLIDFQKGLKKISKINLRKLKTNIINNGFIAPIFIWKDGDSNKIIDGHGRAKALLALNKEGYNIPSIPVDYIKADNEQDARKKLLSITSQYGEFDLGELQDWAKEFDSDTMFRFVDSEIDFSIGQLNSEKYNLKDLFEANPFSVIDGRTGEWQDSKRIWLDVLPDSKEGRGENLTNAPIREYGEGTCEHFAPGTSIFDPQLASVMYKWFCKDGGEILDPFSGGSVRGIIAGLKGYKYTGIDVRQEQIDINIKQSKEIEYGDIGVAPVYIVGDSLKIIPTLEKKYDMVFSCPPYGDLEKYSDLTNDISNMSYKDFMIAYTQIIKLAVGKLKKKGTAVFVVGDIRDKKGIYRSFVPDTISAFTNAGMKYYNEIIFISPNGTAGMRAKRQFTHGRKVVKTHQNILMFVKGI